MKKKLKRRKDDNVVFHRSTFFADGKISLMCEALAVIMHHDDITRKNKWYRASFRFKQDSALGTVLDEICVIEEKMGSKRAAK